MTRKFLYKDQKTWRRIISWGVSENNKKLDAKSRWEYTETLYPALRYLETGQDSFVSIERKFENIN